MLERIEYKELNETLYCFTHSSGVRVYLIPKPGFSKSCAYFASRYGSIDNEFKVNGSITAVPDGIAHFLEHKLFEEPGGGNSFDRFGKFGASANAFTSFNMTAYHFWCTSNFYESLDVLLDFVQTPYFTDENVAKEQGIIGQEINMYRDHPGWQVYFNMLGCLFHNHPIKRDIAGTIESISQITKDTLFLCYNTFYNPSNMVIALAGDFDPHEAADRICGVLKPIAPASQVERLFPNEPASVFKGESVRSLSVARPYFCVGIKDTVAKDARAMVRQRIATKLFLHLTFGKSSTLYAKMYESGLINEQFDFDYSCEDSYAFAEFSGESDKPYEVFDEIKKSAGNINIQNEDFERARRLALGRFLRAFNSPDNLAEKLCRYSVQGLDMFEEYKIYSEITLDEISARAKELMQVDKMVISVVEPV